VPLACEEAIVKKFIALVLFGLVACASRDTWKDQKTVIEYPPGKFQLMSYRELEALRAADAREREARREQQTEQARAAEAKRAEQEAARLEAERARIAADEVRGYKHVSFTDFFLDYKTMPVGSKRAVKGYYRVFGELETLAARPLDSTMDNIPRVVLLSDLAPRDVRAKLLASPCRPAFCQVLLLGHTTTCAIDRLGRPVRSDVCFAIDEIW
jgi:hypothetical protein